MANKFDLTEVEGLNNLLHAETEIQQKQALRQMDGSLNKLYNEWSSKIKKVGMLFMIFQFCSHVEKYYQKFINDLFNQSNLC